MAALLPAQAAAPIKVGRSAALGESCDLCICVFSVADQNRMNADRAVLPLGESLLCGRPAANIDRRCGRRPEVQQSKRRGPHHGRRPPVRV